MFLLIMLTLSYIKLDSWTRKLDEYAYQYSSGVHQGFFVVSPFEAFFGRKANENVEYIKNIGEFYTPSVGEKSYAAWKERVKNLRMMQKAEKNYHVTK